MSTSATNEKTSNVTTVEESAAVAAPTPRRNVVQPLVDIIERDEAIELIADMPGVSAETVDVTLERNALTLHGTASSRNRIYQRAFTLSRRIDRDKIEAVVENGVLKLTLPRVETELPVRKQIAVSAG